MTSLPLMPAEALTLEGRSPEGVNASDQRALIADSSQLVLSNVIKITHLYYVPYRKINKFILFCFATLTK